MGFSFIRKCNLREQIEGYGESDREAERDNLDAFKKQLVSLSFV